MDKDNHWHTQAFSSSKMQEFFLDQTPTPHILTSFEKSWRSLGVSIHCTNCIQELSLAYPIHKSPLNPPSTCDYVDKRLEVLHAWVIKSPLIFIVLHVEFHTKVEFIIHFKYKCLLTGLYCLLNKQSHVAAT